MDLLIHLDDHHRNIFDIVLIHRLQYILTLLDFTNLQILTLNISR
jgi:hypothetical protein